MGYCVLRSSCPSIVIITTYIKKEDVAKEIITLWARYFSACLCIGKIGNGGNHMHFSTSELQGLHAQWQLPMASHIWSEARPWALYGLFSGWMIARPSPSVAGNNLTLWSRHNLVFFLRNNMDKHCSGLPHSTSWQQNKVNIVSNWGTSVALQAERWYQKHDYPPFLAKRKRCNSVHVAPLKLTRNISK